MAECLLKVRFGGVKNAKSYWGKKKRFFYEEEARSPRMERERRDGPVMEGVGYEGMWGGKKRVDCPPASDSEGGGDAPLVSTVGAGRGDWGRKNISQILLCGPCARSSKKAIANSG